MEVNQKEQFYELVKKIPKGKVTTYGLLADASGLASPRLAGRFLHENPTPVVVPCHRVVNNAGNIAENFGFGGKEKQAELLRMEGVQVIGLKVDLKKYLWRPEENIPSIIKNGGVGVLPTDTLYGLVGSALNKKTVERIYRLKGRSENKPLIILISDLSDLKLFNVTSDKNDTKVLEKFWPGKVTFILTANENFEYLTRGTKSLAFRLPKNEELRSIIKETGPLVAPSANPEGLVPAKNISEAKKYFKNRLNFYLDRGEISGSASTLVRLRKGKIEVLRQGDFKIEY